MGMFDYLRSSYDLGEHFTNTRCQTKDIDNTMSDYWLSPSGQLYIIDYSHTADFVELKEGDEGYNAEVPLFNFKWIPNGNHGKVSPLYLTRYVSIYPEGWEGEWKEWPTLKLHFKYGKLMDYEDITGQR
jgi:hypothetical protein